LNGNNKIHTKCEKHFLQQKNRDKRKNRNRNYKQERLNRKKNDPDGLKLYQTRKRKFNLLNIETRLLNYLGKIKKSKRVFSLSNEYFKLLLQTKCFYCGKEPKCNYFKIDRENIEKQNCYNFYSSIDRVDNNKGYIYGNVVPSCDDCNRIKKDFDYDIFLKHMEHITLFWKSNGRVLRYPNITKNIKLVYPSYYKRNCKKLNRIYNLTDEIFYTFRDIHNCYICNKKSKHHKNGIDRINSNEGYYIGNTLSCCYTCNMMKNNRNIYDFIQQCEKIYFYQKIIRLF
jgi:hypothetical protein